MSKLIVPEITNKFFTRKVFLGKTKYLINQNFKIENAKEFKLIKNIIGIELFTGQRPSIIASYLKKSLVINLRITLPSNVIPEILPILQKSPIIWKNYLTPINLFEKGFSYLPIANTKSKIILSQVAGSKQTNWIKSAYLD